MYNYSLSEIMPFNEGRTVNFETFEICRIVAVFRDLDNLYCGMRFENETDAEILRKLEFLLFSE